MTTIFGRILGAKLGLNLYEWKAEHKSKYVLWNSTEVSLQVLLLYRPFQV